MLADMKHMAVARDLAELERHEIIGGDIVQKASPSGAHGYAQASVVRGLGGMHGRGQPGGWWILTEVEVELDTHEVYVPDVAGWRIERTPERPREKPVRVAPDWVCEILSPSTASYDLGHKRRTYHLALIRHYWLIDPQNLTLTVLRRNDADYQVVLAAGPGEVVRAEPFDTIELEVSMIFGLD